MRPRTLFTGLTVTATAVAACLVTTPAHAAPGLVDGAISALGFGCTFANAVTSNTPPATLTIDRTTLVPQCSSGIGLSLANSPTVGFNDIAGTASSAQIDVNGSGLGVACTYRVANASFTRSGTTRTYNGGPYTASKISGGFLCPGTTTVNPITFTFH